MGSDIWQATSTGYRLTDPDDAPTPYELFAELLQVIWDAATPQERRAIARERGALGIRSKDPRDLTATEQAVFDGEMRHQTEMSADWPPADDQPF